LRNERASFEEKDISTHALQSTAETAKETV